MKREELNQLKAGTLHLDCASIELRSHNGTQVHSGPGYIRQDGQRGFTATVFIDGSFSIREAFGPLLEGFTPGMLIPRSSYWSMTATDTSNRSWRADHVTRPSRHGSSGAPGHTVSSELRELVTTRGEHKETSEARCRMRAFVRVPFPPNRPRKTVVSIGEEIVSEGWDWNVAEFEANGFTFELVKETEDETIINANSKSEPLHPFFESRVSEALMFAIGLSIRWAVAETFESGITTTRLRAPRPIRPKKRPNPPVSRDAVRSDTVWALFRQYFGFVCQDALAPFHALSGTIDAVATAADGTVEVEA